MEGLKRNLHKCDIRFDLEILPQSSEKKSCTEKQYRSIDINIARRWLSTPGI